MAAVKAVEIGSVRLGAGAPLVLIAGPCVIESEEHALTIARAVQSTARAHGIPSIFKASFDKANRTSLGSFRGPGLEEGLHVLARVKAEVGLPVLTDIHEPWQAPRVAEVADVLQIPAFLCRQTDLLVAAAKTGAVVNIKKGQFLAPLDMQHPVAKVTQQGNGRVFVTERGTTFGYHNLVVDMRAFPLLRSLGVPVIFDVTHSVQLPGAGGSASSGEARFIEPLASAGVGAGVDGIFVEVHEEPSRAPSDGPNALPLDRLDGLLARLARIRQAVDEG
jgi:2-dehydro-3-deoxyphosphooctonate aldolase (KDO 8-P synthase)